MSAESEPAETQDAPHPYRWAMLAGVWLLYCSFGLTVAALAPLVAPITRELGLSHSAMGAVLGAWPLVYIPAAVFCGAFLDRIGPRRALTIAALVIALSGVLRAFAVDHLSLFLAVALFGVGGPLISIGAPKVISLWFAGKERGLAMGIYFSGNALGGIAALALTNSVVMPMTGGNWRGVLLVYAAFVVFAALAWLALSAHKSSRDIERRLAAEPRPPPFEVIIELARVRSVRLVLVMGIGIFFFNHALNNWLPEILRSGGMDAVSAGYWASVPTVLGVIGALILPRLAVPSRRLAILGILFAGAIAAALLIQQPAGPLLVAGLVLLGLARGSMTIIAVLLLMETREVGPRAIGSAAGMYFSLGEIGGVLGPLTVGYMFDVGGGFTAALYMLAVVPVFMLLMLARVRSALR